MRLAVSMYSYFGAVKDGRIDLPSFIHRAKADGAEGVELLDFFYKDNGRDEEARDHDRGLAALALAETGLPVPIFSVGNNLAQSDPADREAQVDRIRFGVDEALHYGAGVVRVFAGDVREGITFEDARAWIVEGLCSGADYAHERGMKLALENHGKLAGRGEQVRALIEEVRDRTGHAALGANPDFGNFVLVDDSPADAVRAEAAFAYMAHFKDFSEAPASHEGWAFTSLAGKRYLGSCLGEGVVDLAGCLDALRDAGFDGWLSVEYEGTEDCLTAVPRSIARAKALLSGTG
ncbi:MAG: sugar phosphate isomerase/epimerase [Methanoregulaceae archaeon]|nr:sugar phosphate isomerase/epimerase [Methanoregulaceae archaeon]